MSRSSCALLLTCEHGGNDVPTALSSLFAKHRALLQTHRGYDAGTLHLGRALARELEAPLIATTVSRLVVDTNRSRHHRQLFSPLTRALPSEVREAILAAYYTPHREAVTRATEEVLKRAARVIHVGLHSFTPLLDGNVRNADIGLLFDPARAREAAFCRAWRAALEREAPALRIRMNYPYRGKSDGLTTALRKIFPPERYLGIELEVSQGLVGHRGHFPLRLEASLGHTLHASLEKCA